MSQRPLVTVVVPGYQVEPWAQAALDSLRAQTLSDWTAVLVDDASSDRTGDLFEAAAAADPRFRVVRLARRVGLGAARNTALDLVDSPYLAFLDADDVMLPTTLERFVATLDGSGSDFAVGAYVRLRPDGSGGYAAGDVQPWVSRATVPARTGTTLEEHPEVTANVVAWSKLSRTEFWQRTGLRFPEGRLYEDQVVAQQMYARARRFDVLSDVVVHWRERADGSSITQHEERLDVLRDCLDAMSEGMRVLDGTGHTAAARARAGQLLRMDIPRLARVAAAHPDDEYRRLVGAFARAVAERQDAAAIAVPGDAQPLISAALLW
ncbi:glycosyltransferase involved in cell wall biosynthesis [Microbacterium sp. SORGH_AS428]|uniref:glycosyltransferase family 2 protein n=1 Tax=Microbacterium sp. SORGH_AS_0428 TaxID=3041788 RepID=UPI002857FBAC|nr:glycosyltransferase family 2 protein [Microbacterium sp. SORGH_AS_0428]MDR6201149.1 glycosyltransferase involved in cell wall biosynthesis [Microbacterium sp. SORGH_AS_0428]